MTTYRTSRFKLAVSQVPVAHVAGGCALDRRDRTCAWDDGEHKGKSVVIAKEMAGSLTMKAGYDLKKIKKAGGI